MTSVLALLDGIGTPELLVISVLALLMFGSKRLPELGRGLGRAIREFKRATSGVEENLREVLRDDPTPTIRPPLRQGTPRSNANPFTQSTWETPTIETSTASATALPSAASPSPDDAAANASAHDHDATAHDHHSADPAAPDDSGDTPRSSPGSEASHS